MPFRPKIKNADGTLTDLPLESETAVKLKTSRSIGLSGVTATAQSFNGTSAITIPITAVPGSLLTGSTSISTSGNAGTATKLQTARTIGLSGVTATAQSFNGGANITIPITAVPGSLLTGSTSISTTGNAGSATKLATARTIGLSGVTATAKSFDGTGNITIPITAVPASLLTGTASVNTTGNAATATKATNADGIFKNANGGYLTATVDSNGYAQLSDGSTVLRKKPLRVSSIGTSYENYEILSGDTFPTGGKLYEIIYEDNGINQYFRYKFPTTTSGSLTIYFSLLFNVHKSYYDFRILEDGSNTTYKSMKWVIDFTNKTVKQTKYSGGSCAATYVYFKGIYELIEQGGA